MIKVTNRYETDITLEKRKGYYATLRIKKLIERSDEWRIVNSALS